MFSFQVYHSVAEIYDWLDTVAEMPKVQIQTFGQSWENRPLKAVLSEIRKQVTSFFSYPHFIDMLSNLFFSPNNIRM